VLETGLNSTHHPDKGGQDGEKGEKPANDRQGNCQRSQLGELLRNEERGHVEGEHLVAVGVVVERPAQGGEHDGEEQGFAYPRLLEIRGYCRHSYLLLQTKRHISNYGANQLPDQGV
jgi:hypothetical protein